MSNPNNVDKVLVEEQGNVLTAHNFHPRRFLTQTPTDRGPMRLGFNPSGILQSFGFPLPFRKRNKSKESPRRGLNSLVPHQTLGPRELIELANFGIVELDPLERGVGHEFLPAQLKNPTWCDRCGDLIWGLYKMKHFLRCKHCQFTCHQECRDLVSLDCQGIAETRANDLLDLEEDLSQIVPKITTNSPLYLEYFSVDELKERLQKYNETSHGLTITLEADGQTFRGFVRVHLNLTRPINVVSGTRPPSIYDILKDEEDFGRKTLTSFYLPRDTIKALHITSENTTREVIAALLKKFKVIDNPHKFALYERYTEENQLNLRKIQDQEKPLILALMWCEQDKQFVLQENETEDIMWEDFALPELQNFLKILEREEEEYLNQVKRKYLLMQEKIQEAMEHALNLRNSQ